MIRHEIETLKLCQHPHIVRLYDVLENPDYIFLIMEILSGGSLKEYIKNSPMHCCSEDVVRHIILSIGSAIEYMKKYGIVHRDIKAGNIMIADNKELWPTVKLVDFGLAMVLAPGQKCKGFAGTLDYSSPEAFLGVGYDGATDIWSLGITMFYLLTGSMPFSGTQSAELKL